MSPVCLPNPRDEPEIYENVRAVAIGWGTVNVSTGEMPQKLQVISYEIKKLFIQYKALRCTFFGEWKNSCSSKFVQLELLNKAKTRSSKNINQGFQYINSCISNFFGPYSKTCIVKVRAA